METILIILVVCLLLSFSLLIKAYRKIDTLKDSVNDWRDQSNYYEARFFWMEKKYLALANSRVSTLNQKIIPKGTTQAVKEAMKRAHPDNGGNAEDFNMYLRAYNILTGKEKLNA